MPLHYNPSHDSAYTSSSPPNLDKLGGRWQTSLEGMCIYPPLLPWCQGPTDDGHVEEYCIRKKCQPPAFTQYSDRRGMSLPFSSSIFPFRCLVYILITLVLFFPFPLFVIFPALPIVCLGMKGWSLCIFTDFSGVWQLVVLMAYFSLFFLLGGRTAWSSSVIVQGKTFAARYWYDGPFVNNALEDAAEVALIILDPDNHQALATDRKSVV